MPGADEGKVECFIGWDLPLGSASRHLLPDAVGRVAGRISTPSTAVAEMLREYANSASTRSAYRESRLDGLVVARSAAIEAATSSRRAPLKDDAFRIRSTNVVQPSTGLIAQGPDLLTSIRSRRLIARRAAMSSIGPNARSDKVLAANR